MMRDQPHELEPFNKFEETSRIRRAVADPDSDAALAKTTRLPSPTAPRTAAFEFMRGSLQPWSVQDFVGWVELFMIRTGRLALSGPSSSLIVRESGVGALVFGSAPSRYVRGPVIAKANAGLLVRAARQKVVATLASLLASPPDDRFVQTAIYEGRVSRLPVRGRAHGWGVTVNEDVDLSDQVLALFACDLLDHRQEYDAHLAVCEVCGAVELLPERTAALGCSAHPEGLTGVPTVRMGR